MLKRTLTAMGLSALIATLAIPLASAAPVEGEGPRARRGERMARLLELTPEQQRSVKAIRSQFKVQRKAQRQVIKARRDALKALWKAPLLDKPAIRALAAELSTLRDQLRAERLEKRLAIMEILNPDQRARFAEQLGKRGKRGLHKRRGERFKRFERGGKRFERGSEALQGR